MKKHVLITGSSRGIGRAIARQFGEQGYTVFLHCLNRAEDCATLALELKDKCKVHIVKGDLANLSEVERIAREVTALGGVDILINNAGVGGYKMLVDVNEDDYLRIMDTNLKGAMFLTRALLPRMVDYRWGRIISISSMWADMGASCETVYSASKAALEGFTRALAREVGLSSVTVNAIAAGFVATDINAAVALSAQEELRAASALGVFAEPADIAQAAFFIAGEGAKAITGQIIRVDGGYNI